MPLSKLEGQGLSTSMNWLAISVISSHKSFTRHKVKVDGMATVMLPVWLFAEVWWLEGVDV